MSIRFLLPLAVFVSILDARGAFACSCAFSDVAVLPTKSATAPVNTVIRIRVPGRLLPFVTGTRSVGIVVRAAESGKKVAIADREDIKSGRVSFITLRPKHALAPNTRYEVAALLSEGRDYPLGELTTGAKADRKKPELGGVAEATYHHEPAICCNCSTGDPYVVLRLKDSRGASLFAVWAGPVDGEIDYDKPPLTYVAARGRTLVLGHASACSVNNFDFPSGAKSIRIGVVAVDMAGNRSAPGEVVAELKKR